MSACTWKNMNIDVYLPSGQCASVVLPPHATVSDVAEYWGRSKSLKQCCKNSITQMWWLKPLLNDNGKTERCGYMIVSVADDDCVVGIVPCLRRSIMWIYSPWIGNWTLFEKGDNQDCPRWLGGCANSWTKMDLFHKQTSETPKQNHGAICWGDLKLAAQQKFNLCFLRLTRDGHCLELKCTLDMLGLTLGLYKQFGSAKKKTKNNGSCGDILDILDDMELPMCVHCHFESLDRKRVFRRPR